MHNKIAQNKFASSSVLAYLPSKLSSQCYYHIKRGFKLQSAHAGPHHAQSRKFVPPLSTPSGRCIFNAILLLRPDLADGLTVGFRENQSAAVCHLIFYIAVPATFSAGEAGIRPSVAFSWFRARFWLTCCCGRAFEHFFFLVSRVCI